MDPQHPIDLKALRTSAESGYKTGNEVPSNPIITDTLETIIQKQAQVIPLEKLSPTGQAISHDVAETLKDTERLVEEKNRNDLLQRIIQHTVDIVRMQQSEVGREAINRLFKESTEPIAFMGRVMRDQNFPERMKHITKSLVVSPNFRQLLSETVAILQQVVLQATAATKEQLEKEPSEKVVEQPEEMGKTFAEAVKKGTKEPIEEKDIKQRLIDRFINLIKEVQDNPNYQEAVDMVINNFFNIYLLPKDKMSSWEDQIEKLEPSEQHVIKEIRSDTKEMLLLVKQLIENLCNCPIEDSLETFKDIFSQLSNDEEAVTFLNKTGEWIERCLRDKEYIGGDPYQVRKDIESLWGESHGIIIEKYRPSVQHFLGQIRYYLDRMKRDPLAQKLSGDISTLTSHLFYDAQGNPTLKPELISDLQKIVPAILRNLRFIKIPDIDVHEPGLDFIASDVVINVAELAPHHLRLTVTSDIPESEAESPFNMIEFEMSKIHAEARNIRFSIKKSGLPPLNDSGLADFCIFEDGMWVKLWLQPIIGTAFGETGSGSNVRKNEGEEEEGKTAESQPIIKAGLQVTKCDCRLEHFDLNVHGSGHDWMYYLLGPYIRRLVRQRIEEAVQNFFLTTDLMATLAVPAAIGEGLESSQSQPVHSSPYQSQPGEQPFTLAASQ